MLSATGELVRTSQELARQVDELSFTHPVAVVYNPLTYAWGLHSQYLERWGESKGRIIFMGMNPGPWGMAQTAIPFGAVPVVRDWLRLDDSGIAMPRILHPKRPIQGFSCTRQEVSGMRLWGLFQNHFATADEFFTQCFVLNYCPLVFMDHPGRNLTPDKLPKLQRQALEAICTQFLIRMLEILEPRAVVGVGTYARDRLLLAKNSLDFGSDLPVIMMPHPSPASPKANNDWRGQAEAALLEGGLCLSQ